MASLSGINIDRGSINTTIRGLHETESRMKRALEIIADVASKKMADWAKDNKLWEDRTTNATQGLQGKAYWEDDKNLVTAIYHSVDYGIWLELAMNRKYAILEKAIEEGKDDLIRQYKRIVGDL